MGLQCGVCLEPVIAQRFGLLEATTYRVHASRRALPMYR